MEGEKGEKVLRIPSSTIIKVALFVAFAWVFIQLIELVISILTALIIASAIEPAVRFLSSYKIPRLVSIIGVYITTILGFVVFVYELIPVVFEQGRRLIERLPDILVQLQEEFTENKLLSPIFSNFNSDPVALKETVASFLEASSTFTLGLTSVFLNGLITLILITVLSFYFSVEEKNVTKFIETMTPDKYKKYIIDLWARSKEKIGLWMKGQIVLILVTGGLVYLGLLIIGIQDALIFAVIAGFMELIPVFGAFISAILPIMVAFIDGGWTLGFITMGFFIFIQQFESNLIYPLVVKNVLGVPSVLVILSLVIGGTLAGILGVIIAVPMAAILQELIHDVRHKKIQKFIETK